MQRVLGLDVGDKTIGVAVSDPLGLTAQGLTVLRRCNLAADVQALWELLRHYQTQEVVIGLPLNMDGSKGPQAAVAEALGQALERQGVTISYVDERLSTMAATRTLLAADVSRKRRRQVVDKLAAQIILDVFLRRKGISKEDV